MEKTKEVESAIKLLNKFGQRILEIEGSFYVVSSFEEAQSTNWNNQEAVSEFEKEIKSKSEKED